MKYRQFCPVAKASELAEVYAGDTTVQTALEARRLEIKGPPKLTRNVHRWLRASPLAAIPSARVD